MPSAGIETAIPATKRPQHYALDRAATGIGIFYCPELIRSLLNLPVILKNNGGFEQNTSNASAEHYRYINMLGLPLKCKERRRKLTRQDTQGNECSSNAATIG
jgi:hypothetical protein